MADGTIVAPGVSLRQALPSALISGGDVRVRGCCTEPGHCRGGDLFVSFDNDPLDVAEAIAHGAVAVLSEQNVRGLRVPVAKVTNLRAAFGRICQALVQYPCRDLRVVGVTGSSGKTVTARLIAEILNEAGYDTAALGSGGCFDGASWSSPSLHPLPVAQWLRRSLAQGCSHAVLEMTAAALAQSHFSGIELDVLCLNAMRHEGRSRHGDWTTTVLEHLRPEGFAVVNADDPASRPLLHELDGPVLTVGIEQPAEVQAVPLEQHASEQLFLLCNGRYNVPVRTSLVGRANLYHLITAAAVGLVYGIELPTIVRGLERVQRVAGRLDRIECGQTFGVFVDEASTPTALESCLDTLRPLTSGRLICVFAGQSRSSHEWQQLGHIVESAADVAVLTTANSTNTSHEAMALDVQSGFDDPNRCHIIPQRPGAIRWALDLAEPGDCVLIAGQRACVYTGQHSTPDDMTDRGVAEACLYEMAARQRSLRRAA